MDLDYIFKYNKKKFETGNYTLYTKLKNFKWEKSICFEEYLKYEKYILVLNPIHSSLADYLISQPTKTILQEKEDCNFVINWEPISHDTFFENYSNMFNYKKE